MLTKKRGGLPTVKIIVIDDLKIFFHRDIDLINAPVISGLRTSNVNNYRQSRRSIPPFEMAQKY